MYRANLRILQKLNYCTKVKSKPRIKVILDNEVNQELTTEAFKPRKHPGVINSACIAVPDHIIKAIQKAVKDYPVKALWTGGQLINNYIISRKLPLEKNEKLEKQTEIRDEVINDLRSKYNVEVATADQIKRIEDMAENLTRKNIKQKMYAWKPIEFDEYKSLEYLFGRSAQEYAILMRIFKEIKQRDPDFKPRSFFDFGAGVGTGTWAVSSLWKDNIFEYFLVDASSKMNELSDLILRGGEPNKELSLKTVYHRQFLPHSENSKYDIVLCAFSLFEQPSMEERLKIINNLMKKCANYLIFVESGTNAGFKAIEEVRDYVIQKVSNVELSVFSPCPHELSCPRMAEIEKTPCNFFIRYTKLPFSASNSDAASTLFSYVVFKKGNVTDHKDWPRIVRPTLVRSKHTVCRMCTDAGKLQEIIFTAAKHGKYTYRCARSSSWGDRLPITLDYSNFTEKVEEIDVENDNSISDKPEQDIEDEKK